MDAGPFPGPSGPTSLAAIAPAASDMRRASPFLAVVPEAALVPEAGSATGCSKDGMR